MKQNAHLSRLADVNLLFLIIILAFISLCMGTILPIQFGAKDITYCVKFRESSKKNVKFHSFSRQKVNYFFKVQ